jgi:hypothetical protein
MNHNPEQEQPMSTTRTPLDFVARWSDPAARPLFKGKLIDDDGCCCAQGDVLRVCGWTDDQLRATAQSDADAEVADLLGISRFHSALLRHVNDQSDGCPQAVLTEAGLAAILGPNWRLMLAFGRHIDTLGAADWKSVAAALAAARAAALAAAWDAALAAALAAAWDAARDAARDAAGTAAGAAARAAAGAAARTAAWECIGISRLASPFFLRMFFGDGTQAWIEANREFADPVFSSDAAKGGAL